MITRTYWLASLGFIAGWFAALILNPCVPWRECL